MNPTQAAARQTIFSSPVKPRVLSAASYTGTTSVTFDVPRSPGKLCIIIVANVGGAAAPSLPTGFTNLASQAYSVTTNMGTRVAYKYLDGSEAATLSTTVSAGTTAATVLLIDGAVSTRVPTISTVSNSTSTASPNPGAVTITAPVTQALVIATYSRSAAGTPTQLPTGFTYAKSAYVENTMSQFTTWQENFCVSSFDPGAFTVGAINITSAYTIAVRTI